MQRNFIFNGGNSTRYHTFDVHTRQCIGNHSFGVAWMCELITEGRASKNLIMAALAHDLAEHIVGDIPAPAKRALNLQKLYDEFETQHLVEAGIGNYQLLAWEKTVLKLSDCMEGLQFCIRERKFGNRNVDVAFGNFTSYICKLLNENAGGEHIARAALILSQLQLEWKEVTL